MTSSIFAKRRDAMVDVFGPLVDLPAGEDRLCGYAVIPGVMPPGTVIPLHSHADRETMLIIEGRFGAWLDGAWRTYDPGEVIDIPPDAPHALRNDGPDEVSLVLVTTPRMADFFRVTSAPASEADVSPERLEHLIETSAAYGYWLGGVEDQAAVGITLP